MDPNQLVNDAKNKLKQALDHLQDDLKKVRTGRAHPTMLDGIIVTAYGTPMPLNQVASISTPEPQLLQISPYDTNNLQAIATAIRDNKELGLNPMDDGKVVRLPIPPLNEERRLEYTKIVSKKLEDHMVVCRNLRHDVLKEIDKLKKDKQISEDDASRLTKQIEDEMSHIKTQAESVAKAKEQEILTV
jgi:ribosome recycling factor